MPGPHVVVIGGSLAGLSAGRVLSDYFDRVTVIDRDAYPEGALERPGVPQSRHVHALLARGCKELDTMFPGFGQAMHNGGAHELDFASTFATLRPTGWAQRLNNHLEVFFASRTLIESSVRGLFRKLRNVILLERTTVTSLVAVRHGTPKVTGVQITPLDGGASTLLEADLIVDASGRASKAPEWLRELGLTPPAETVVDSFSGYSSRCKAPTPEQLPQDWWWKGVWIDIKLPENTFAGVLFPVEHGRWLVTLAGVAKNYPPSDEAGFMAALHQLRSPLIGEMVRFAEPISPVYSNRAMANRFRHYEQWQERLDGFLALGDAACAFNPVYGQGMTTGTVSATILRDCLKQYGPTSPDLPRQFFRAQARFQQHPWGLATGADFRFPTTEGQRPRVSHLISPYMETLFRAGDDDAVIRHQVGHVLNLLKLPPALFAPHIVARCVVGLEAQAQGSTRSRTTSLGHAAGVGVGGIESRGRTSGDVKAMADKERLQEFIKYRVEWIRLLWITLVAAGSGEVSLLLGGLPAFAQKGAAVIGIMFLLMVGLIVSRLDKQAREAIEKLKEV